MNKKKIAVVFGTRPEAIKMAPVIKELEKYPEEFEVQTIVTAQHREMLDQVLKVFGIKPNVDLNIMKKDQSLSDITTHVLKGLEEVYKQNKPDMILVHGDTTTSFSAALAAYYQKIPIAHVEAGLRTNNKYFPFPEEVNRQLIDNVADLFFAPTNETRENLLKENKAAENIVVTGNTAIDAVYYTKTLKFDSDIVKKMKKSKKKWILLTMHRRENYGKPMDNVFQAIKEIVHENDDVEVLIPVHLSPSIQNHVKEVLGKVSRVHLISPLEVHEFHQVIGQATIVMTDSGGLQEEAPALNIPVLVLRDNTERPEGQKAGTLEVVGTEKKSVYTAATRLLEDSEHYKTMAEAKNPYGDGKSSSRIVKRIQEYFSGEE